MQLNKNQQNRTQMGFVAFYALTVMVVLSILTLILYNTAITQNTTSKLEAESLKAFYAADAGIECAKYYQDSAKIFTDPTPHTFTCGGSTFTTSGVINTMTCQSLPQDFGPIAMDNGACTKITIYTYLLTTITSGPQAGTKICGVNIVSSGKNSCTNPTVERVRWETR